MAGRPRTMLKRVTRILERQQRLAEELRELMPKQYLPGPGEGWDYPENAEEGGHDLMRSWRKAVLEIGWPTEYLEDLIFLLEMKVEKVEQNARLETDDEDDSPDHDIEQPESPNDCGECPIPDDGEAANGQTNLAGQDAVQVAAS